MRQTRVTTKFAAGAISLVLGAAVLATAMLPAHAEDDDTPIDKKILRSILEGFGLKKDGEAINYQERPPLVLPPGNTLRPPERSDVAVAKNPAWPSDPDVQRRKVEADQEKNRLGASDAILHDQRVLRPDELTPGSKQRVTRRTDPDAYQTPAGGIGNPLPASELGQKKSIFSNFFGGKDEADNAKFTGEPPRASLTEPPPGYQTPSPDQPYGVTREKPKAPTAAENYTNRPSGGP